MDLEDLFTATDVRSVNDDATVKAARPKKGWV